MRFGWRTAGRPHPPAVPRARQPGLPVPPTAAGRAAAASPDTLGPRTLGAGAGALRRGAWSRAVSLGALGGGAWGQPAGGPLPRSLHGLQGARAKTEAETMTHPRLRSGPLHPAPRAVRANPEPIGARAPPRERSQWARAPARPARGPCAPPPQTVLRARPPCLWPARRQHGLPRRRPGAHRRQVSGRRARGHRRGAASVLGALTAQAG